MLWTSTISFCSSSFTWTLFKFTNMQRQKIGSRGILRAVCMDGELLTPLLSDFPPQALPRPWKVCYKGQVDIVNYDLILTHGVFGRDWAVVGCCGGGHQEGHHGGHAGRQGGRAAGRHHHWKQDQRWDSHGLRSQFKFFLPIFCHKKISSIIGARDPHPRRCSLGEPSLKLFTTTWPKN